MRRHRLDEQAFILRRLEIAAAARERVPTAP